MVSPEGQNKYQSGYPDGRQHLQAQLRDRQRQLKGLTSEMNMDRAAVKEHKDAVTRLQNELHDMKHLWLEAKKQVID